MKKQLFATIVLLMVACFTVFAQSYNRYNTDPDPFDVQTRVYKAALRYYDLQAATTALYKMMALKPERSDLNDSLALIYFAGERYAQAYLVGEQILKTNSGRNDILELVAVSKQNLGLTNEALDDYEKLYHVDKSVFYLYQISTLQYQLKRYNECLSSLDKVISSADADKQKVSIKSNEESQEVPMKAAAYNVKGICSMELQNSKDARKYFDMALELYPEFKLAKANIDVLDGKRIRDDKDAENIIAESGMGNLSNKQNLVNKVENKITSAYTENNLPLQNEKDNGITKPKLPPSLSITNLSYFDNDKTNRLDAKETAYIKFVLVNNGKGEAYDLEVIVKEKTGIKGFTVGYTSKIPVLTPGEKRDVLVPFTASKEIPTAKATLSINISEANGFDSDPGEIEFRTQEFLVPKVEVVSQQFSNEEGGKARLGIPLNLRFIVQNIGQGEANDVTCNITLPDNVFPSDETDYAFGKLKSGESKEINFGFFGNKKYTSTTIPIKINVREKENYAESKTVELNLDEVLVSTKKVEVKAQDVNLVDIKVASLTSDVDKNIPINIGSNPHRYALIVGNEDYTKYQNNLSSESNVAYAVSDAGTFAAYCEKTLGVQRENITLLQNAIGSKMKQEIDKLSKLVQYENGNAEIIFYYAGHGFPDETTKESYIMPVDISGANVTDGIKLSDLYQKLTANPVKRVSVFLDACFSGGGRDAGLLAARSVKIKPKANAIGGNLLVMSASTGEQSSLPYKEKQHGMFTYFLLKKLQETKGEILYKDLFDYVKQQVELNSIKVNGKDQNPQLISSSAIDRIWEEWKMKK